MLPGVVSHSHVGGALPVTTWTRRVPVLCRTSRRDPFEPPGGADLRIGSSVTHHPEEMTKLKQRPRREVTQPTPYEEARDEMFQHIMQCGVIGSHPDDQKEWFDATMQYMTTRYPELSEAKVTELRTLGERFAQPLKAPTPEAEAVTA